MKKPRAALACLTAVLVVGLAVAWWLPRSSAAPEARFITLGGETFSMSQLRGKVVLVEFWATTCGICAKSMPRMADTYRRFAPQGFEIVAVAGPAAHPAHTRRLRPNGAPPLTVRAARRVRNRY